MNYIKYSRSFIILEDKDSQFRNTDQSIKGHVKIEFRNNRGTIRCIAQNLKYYEDARYLYKLYLFGKKNDTTILANAGTLYIDRNGKGEQVFRFNALNVDGENNELFDFSIIAIVAQPNKDILDDDTLYPVSTGFLNRTSSESVDRIINIAEQPAPQEVSQEASNEVPQKKSQEVNQEIIQDDNHVKIASEDTSIPIELEVSKDEPQELESKSIEAEDTTLASEPGYKGPQIQNDAKVEMDSEPKQASAAWQTPPSDIGSKPSPDLNTIPNPQNIKAASTEPPSSSAQRPTISKKPYDVHNYFTNYVRAVSTNLENVLPFYNQSEPFDVDKIGCQWWKIMNLMSIPFVNTSYLQSYPEYIRPYSMFNQNPKEMSSSCHDLIYKYQHYIFGIDKDNNNNTLYYYYGIPGRYMKEEQPDRGSSGFEYWQPLQGTKKRKGDYGYWIIAVNAKTGQLEIPFEG